MWRDVWNCRPTKAKISPSLWSDGSFGHRNGEYRSFILFFFTILYHLLDCKIVSDQFWVIYGIAENPQPTGSEIRPRHLEVKVFHYGNNAIMNPWSKCYKDLHISSIFLLMMGCPWDTLVTKSLRTAVFLEFTFLGVITSAAMKPEKNSFATSNLKRKTFSPV